jgi:UDP-N-acetylmuramoyl-tripeptide--D-alanyl-D-alanine ligase
MQLTDLATLLNLRLDTKALCSGFSIDTRTLEPGQCYIALRGENHDGHDFVSQAFEIGASCAIVEKKLSLSKPLLKVPSTYQALNTISAHHRNQYELPVIAITGSCGKTTVKEMVHHLLPKPSLATKGNLNNHIGVPISLLSLEPYHRYAVFELGANHIGEIAQTVKLVKPKVALINNIAPAHLEGFGSIEGVACAKGEIYQGLDKEGIAIVNLDDVRVAEKANQYADRQISFSLKDERVDLFGFELQPHPHGISFKLSYSGKIYPVVLQVPGEHNVYNALAALAVGLSVGLPIMAMIDSLSEFQGVKGRLQRKQGIKGCLIIDDTYNANLASMKAALRVLGAQKSETIAVLGELAEVGDALSSHYREIAKYANQLGIKKLYTLGKQIELMRDFFKGEYQHFELKDKELLIGTLISRLKENECVLVKGSRSSRMEEVVGALLQ